MFQATPPRVAPPDGNFGRGRGGSEHGGGPCDRGRDSMFVVVKIVGLAVAVAGRGW